MGNMCKTMAISEILCRYDIDWYAVDRIGQVAVFYTMSIGPVPESACQYLTKDYNLFPALQAMLSPKTQKGKFSRLKHFLRLFGEPMRSLISPRLAYSNMMSAGISPIQARVIA